jgi:hypothetical protein
MIANAPASPGSQDDLQLLDLKTAARLDRSGRGGRPPHIASLCRWIQDGVRLRGGGRLRLRATRVPSGWRTTRRWLEEFRRTLTADRLGRDHGDDPVAESAVTATSALRRTPGRRSAADRRAASQKALEILRQLD